MDIQVTVSGDQDKMKQLEQLIRSKVQVWYEDGGVVRYEVKLREGKNGS